jgi:hypothetical protein
MKETDVCKSIYVFSTKTGKKLYIHVDITIPKAHTLYRHNRQQGVLDD